MVLRPEYEWSVPQQRAPVCTTLGQKPLIQPVMVNSSLLLGTPLDDAADTQVGSIMPKFKYTEYITVPGEQLPKCAGGADAACLPKCDDAEAMKAAATATKTESAPDAKAAATA
jgi:hypothetical protein